MPRWPNFAETGNDLYTGKRSIDFIRRQKTWYAVSGVLIALALLGIFARGLNFGIEFRGGSEYRISGVSNTSGYEDKARAAVTQAGIPGNVVTTVIGGNSVRVQTEAAGDKNDPAKAALASAFGVGGNNVSASLIGPSWGASVSSKAIQALVVFLILVALVMAAYFRTWKMALAGLVALLHDLVITVGIYALFGFEITPSSMIGFLTILGYSLYDTVVVFDKVRENTAEAFATRRRTYTQAANLAVNQTLVRSVNTTVVALLPIAAILVVGFTLLGPGTLLDLSLALFVGIAVGAYSSIFIATPLLVDLRRGEPAVKDLDRAAIRSQQRDGAPTGAGGGVGAPAQRTAAGARARTDRSPARGSGSTAVLTRPDGTVELPGTPVQPVNGADLTHGDGEADSPKDAPVTPRAAAGGREVHKWAASGPRNQPRRPPRSKR
jgi:preprotein translocase subunit SecF